MSDKRSEEFVIPARLFNFPADGGLVGVRSQEVESDLAQEGNVLRAVVLAVSGGVLAEVDIQNSMQFAFDLPMGSYNLDQRARRHGGGEQEVADMAGQMAVGMTACGLDAADGLQAREVDIVDSHNAGAACLDAVMGSLGCNLDALDVVGVLDAGERLGQEAGLVGLECQSIIIAGGEDGAGGVGPAMQGIGGDDRALQCQQRERVESPLHLIATGASFWPMTRPGPAAQTLTRWSGVALAARR